MKAAVKQHGLPIVAIAMAITGVVLDRLWPEGVAVAKKSHEAIAPLVDATSDEVLNLQAVVAVERTKRRELARRVHVLEERMMSREVAAASRAHAVVPTPEEREEEVAATDAVAESESAVPADTVVPVDIQRSVRRVPTFDSLDE